MDGRTQKMKFALKKASGFNQESGDTAFVLGQWYLILRRLNQSQDNTLNLDKTLYPKKSKVGLLNASLLGVVRFLPLFFEILASTIAMVFQTYRFLTMYNINGLFLLWNLVYKVATWWNPSGGKTKVFAESTSCHRTKRSRTRALNRDYKGLC